MQFGEWKLRDDASYYLSKDSMVWPSSNAVDEGKLTTEENMRNIYRYLGIRNFVTKYNYFSLTLNANRDGVVVSPGEAVIQGYHFYSKSAINIKVPDNTQLDDKGVPKESNYQRIDEYTLGIALAYDAANHVTGDVVNKAEEVGNSETLSGVYLKWFDKCQLECNYNNILVLGRAWVKQGLIVPDGTIIAGGRTIWHGFEPDPFKDHVYDGDKVEIEVHGHKTTQYDTLRDNMTQVHEPLYSYDSSHFPVELVREKRTKPPTFNTDVQDYINHLPDWYTSKYGDYMTGALRFNNLSIDAKREFLNQEITKDSINDDKYADSAFISPRTHGDLVRNITQSVEKNNYNYDVGGTLMSIVPNTYPLSTDNNNGYTGIHAALLSQLYGETGLILHYGKGHENDLFNTTRLVHYNSVDSGTIKNSKNTGINENTSNFIIENTDNTGRKVSIDFRNGELFIDSYNSVNDDSIFKTQKLTETSGESYGSGIQIYVNGKSHKDLANRLDFRFDETKMSMAQHDYEHHRNGNRGIQHEGLNSDDLHFEMGLGINYNGNQINTNSDAFVHMDNLLIRSNDINNAKTTVKQNTISIFNSNNEILPYIRILPRVYSNEYLAEDLVQVGTHITDDYFNHDAENSTINRIIMKRVNKNEQDNQYGSYTYLEQDYNANGNSRLLNKWLPPMNGNDLLSENGYPIYEEIAGMYSTGNIGCSFNKDMITSRYDNNKVDPYSDDSEWVRFTRFRYDNERDLINGGSYEGDHEKNDGRKWGETYNIEFNTNVANRRSNQLIWRYNGSKGKQNEITLDNTPPVVLSYVHDNSSIKDQGVPTKYTNINDAPGYNNGAGTFETWIDHAGITQFNPTYKIRDFLLLENAGLVVSGDINNPSISGDSLNTVNHLGVTISAGRVYNAVYNDFAETFEKNNKNEIASPGTLIALNPDTGKYEICDGFENKCIVGVQSNSYAYLAGGNRINNTQDIIDLENEYFTVAVSGKVWVNVVSEDEDILNCHIKPGDLLTSSKIKGKACQSKYLVQGTIIGKALTEPKYFKDDNQLKVLMLVMTV
nr:MAG TPA: peptidase [Caudoviricetes sp.]